VFRSGLWIGELFVETQTDNVIDRRTLEHVGPQLLGLSISLVCDGKKQNVTPVGS
jgi:hypothetical protein